MGKLLSGINGPIRGKVGTVTGALWKGIPYLRSLPIPRDRELTTKEKNNRSKFAMAHAWLHPVLDFVRQGFKGYSLTVEGFIAAKSYLLRNAFEGVQPGISINPALVKMSHGSLPLSGNITAEKTADNKFLFTWDTATVTGGHGADQVMVLAYDIEHAYARFNITGQFRNVGSQLLDAFGSTGDTYHLWLAFTAHDRSRLSDSVYLGAIEL
jgi:hypothetical protein